MGGGDGGPVDPRSLSPGVHTGGNDMAALPLRGRPLLPSFIPG